MVDQEIYKKLAQIVFNAAPNIDMENHMVAHVEHASVTTVFWVGKIIGHPH